jgi:hypothetical protein
MTNVLCGAIGTTRAHEIHVSLRESLGACWDSSSSYGALAQIPKHEITLQVIEMIVLTEIKKQILRLAEIHFGNYIQQ